MLWSWCLFAGIETLPKTQGYLLKAGFEKIASPVGDNGVYIAQNFPRLGDFFLRVREFPEEFWSYGNLTEHFKIIWQNILSGYIQGVSQNQ